MRAWLNDVIRLVETHQSSVIGVTAFSIACLVGSILALPFLVARAPSDYFVREHAPKDHVLRKVLRNLLGALLLVVGIVMLVLPGQGLLSILVALTLLDFPGKHGLLRRLVARHGVARALQWMRLRAHKPPFELPTHVHH